jgi:hypothetical protein
LQQWSSEVRPESLASGLRALLERWDALRDGEEFRFFFQEEFGGEFERDYFLHIVERHAEVIWSTPWAVEDSVTLGRVLLRAQDWTRGRAFLQEAVVRHPGQASLLALLAEALYQMGDVRSSREYYCTAFYRDPEEVDVGWIGDPDVHRLVEMADSGWKEGGLAPTGRAWIPALGVLSGVFPVIRILFPDLLRPLAQEFRDLTLKEMKEDQRNARLFYLGVILCENPRVFPSLEMVEEGRVRDIMREAHPTLYGLYAEGREGDLLKVVRS